MDALILEKIEEELGISDEVTRYAEEVSDLVLRNIQTQPKIKVVNGLQTNTFRFKQRLFDTDVNFEIKNNYFSDVKFFMQYRKNHRPQPNKYKHDSNTIRIEVDYVNGWHDHERLEGAIQHELEHLFQDFKKGYHREETIQYNTASANYSNKNETIRLVSQIIYFSEGREIYAFANQAYQMLMEEGIDPRDAIKNTNLYKGYSVLKNGETFLMEHSGDKGINLLLSKFDTNNARLLKHCQWAIDEYAKYIGRVIVKVEKDKLDEDLNEGVHIEML